MLAQARLQILVLPDRMQHEANALRLGSREEHDPTLDHSVTQQGWGLVEEHEVEPVASFPFVPNQCIIFVKTFNSLHCVRPMQAEDSSAMRRTLTINIEKKE